MPSEDLKTLFQHITPAQALHITPAEYTDGILILTAPIEPNLNDKNTGFAGSVASILSLAGWGTITLPLRKAGIKADVMIVKSEIDYLKPATHELRAEAILAPAAQQLLIREVHQRGRGRQSIQATLYSNGIECARMMASYAIVVAKS